MKRILILSFLFIFISINAQTKNFSLKRGNYTSGISGNFYWDNVDQNIKEVNGDVKSEMAESGSQLSFKSGYFVADNFLIGLLYSQTIDELETKPDPNPNGDFNKDRKNYWFAGLWSRYYVPISSINFAVFGELSLGYLFYEQQNQNLSTNIYSREFTRTDGFAYVLGGGVAYFLTEEISFDLAINFQGSNSTGNVEYSAASSDPIDISIFNTKLLLGIQIYLAN